MSIEQTEITKCDNYNANEAADWQYKYRSAFTYAAYNDLDKMGYQAPKRYAKQFGPRYSRNTDAISENEPSENAPQAPRIAVEAIFVILSFIIFVLTLPLSLLFSLKFVGDFERLVVLRLGRAQRTRGPGATVVLPCIDTFTKVDLRVNAFNVPPMQIITIDRGLVELGATVFLQVKDALAAVCAVQERNQSTRTLAIAILHRLVCKRQVNDLTCRTGRQQLCETLQSELANLTNAWGVEITKIELSDVKVIKEGENMALVTFNKVLRSEFGSKILETLTSTAQEFIAEQQQRTHPQEKSGTSSDLIDLNGSECGGKSNMESKKDFQAANMDIDRLLCSLSMVLDERLVAAVGHIFQVNCADMGNFYVDLKNGVGNCCEGTSPSADVTFCLNKEMLAKIFQKQITPMQAYLDGSLRIQGSIKAAIKLTLLSDRLSYLL